MISLKNVVMTAAVLAFSVNVASPAQDCAVGIKPPAAGSWAEYTTADGTMRLAVLGHENRAGKDLIRFEMNMTTKDGPVTLQVLASGYPYEMSSVQDFVVKPAGGPAMRLSGQMLQMMQSRMPKDAIADACRNAQMKRVGEETITVPAGTFQTIHYRDETSGNDVWVSESVPFGLVKTSLARGGEIVLTGKGTGAKSQITEPPQEMTMPGGRP